MVRKLFDSLMDEIGNAPIILFDASLGAAVALQTAAEDERVQSVISMATFSDLK